MRTKDLGSEGLITPIGLLLFLCNVLPLLLPGWVLLPFLVWLTPIYRCNINEINVDCVLVTVLNTYILT